MSDLSSGEKPLEVKAQTDAQPEGAVIGKVVERHLIIEGRFERDVTVKEERVAHFQRNLYIVVIRRVMNVFCNAAEVNTSLVKVITCGSTYTHVVNGARVVIAYVGFQ